jgi:serine/threonine protein kinase
MIHFLPAGEYTMPPELSSTCQDLIRNILLVNPENRISIDKIRTHPWVGSAAAKNAHVEPKLIV